MILSWKSEWILLHVTLRFVSILIVHWCLIWLFKVLADVGPPSPLPVLEKLTHLKLTLSESSADDIQYSKALVNLLKMVPAMELLTISMVSEIMVFCTCIFSLQDSLPVSHCFLHIFSQSHLLACFSCSAVEVRQQRWWFRESWFAACKFPVLP